MALFLHLAAIFILFSGLVVVGTILALTYSKRKKAIKIIDESIDKPENNKSNKELDEPFKKKKEDNNLKSKVTKENLNVKEKKVSNKIESENLDDVPIIQKEDNHLKSKVNKEDLNVKEKKVSNKIESENLDDIPIIQNEDTHLQPQVEPEVFNEDTHLQPQVEPEVFNIKEDEQLNEKDNENIPNFEYYPILNENPPAYPALTAAIGMYQFKNSLKVRIIRGSLLNNTFDAIVIPTNHLLNLCCGTGKLLAQVAGEEFNNACANKTMKTGELFVTAAGPLIPNITQVIFFLPPRYTLRDFNEKMKAVLCDVLKEAEKRSFNTIAFSEMLAGNFDISKELLAKILVDALHSFDSDHPGSLLQNVCYVSTDGNMIDIFTQKIKDYSKKGVCFVTVEVPILPATLEPLTNPGVRKIVNNNVLHSFVMANGTKVEIVKGQIADESCDSIVSPADDKLKNNAGVAMEIAVAAGDNLKKQCEEYINKKKTMAIGDALVTSSGKLAPHISYVIHVVGLNLKDINFDILYLNTLLKILQIAEDRSSRSIAIPALSTGGSSKSEIPAYIVANIFLEALLKFNCRKRKLETIKLVNSDQKTVDTFRNIFVQYFSQFGNIK